MIPIGCKITSFSYACMISQDTTCFVMATPSPTAISQLTSLLNESLMILNTALLHKELHNSAVLLYIVIIVIHLLLVRQLEISISQILQYHYWLLLADI